ncbi:uncharacterized protein HaLaN_09668 [Haematococcus lacustris]|uniref:YkgJ family cysteine cluster protein n=1 Tax=Haematococcus lacustris TaxID=44745 RepID=A0A699Z2P1_HAELA|nr:uncharacterized protein HaLaN_09668 [Haematococcus lacustris]
MACKGTQISMAELEWASTLQGKSFLCTQCGKCCTGEGEVWVSSEELLRISEHLHLTPQAFQRRYTEKHSGCKGWHLLLTKGEEQNCVFLQDKQCSIHAVRPRQCATYPWWPELMDPADWQREKDNICEGAHTATAGAKGSHLKTVGTAPSVPASYRVPSGLSSQVRGVAFPAVVCGHVPSALAGAGVVPVLLASMLPVAGMVVEQSITCNWLCQPAAR